MRIIAGKYKGKKLVSPKDDKIRPTADKVKEAIFSMLAMEISGKNILDLFGGTGALGLEAISRGAENVCIVDSSPRATAIIYQNINNV
jgi:16S rRNA (guanine(966)-N(2))-methyltransferase RsmD